MPSPIRSLQPVKKLLRPDRRSKNEGTENMMMQKSIRKSRLLPALSLKRGNTGLRTSFVLLFCTMVLDVTIFAQTSYKEIKVANGGTIAGTVRLHGNTAGMTKIEITKDHSCCGVAKISPRLDVAKNGSVRNAVVYLENISEGKKTPGPQKVRLNQQKCEY